MVRGVVYKGVYLRKNLTPSGGRGAGCVRLRLFFALLDWVLCWGMSIDAGGAGLAGLRLLLLTTF